MSQSASRSLRGFPSSSNRTRTHSWFTVDLARRFTQKSGSLTMADSTVAVRFIIALTVNIFLTFVFNRKLQHPGISNTLRHGFMAGTGAMLAYFVHGAAVLYYHTLCYIATCAFIYTFYKFARLDLRTVGAVTWTFCAALFLHYLYLLYANQTDQYDLDFTTSQGLLVFRHIGLVIDMYDGAVGSSKGGASQPQSKAAVAPHANALTQIPPMMSILGYSYASCISLAGPLICFREYNLVVQTNRDDILASVSTQTATSIAQNDLDMHCSKQIYRTIGSMAVLMSLYVTGTIFFPIDAILTAEFAQRTSLSYKSFYYICCGAGCMAQYFLVWALITISGYTGQMLKHEDPPGNKSHSLPETRLINARPWKHFTAIQFRDLTSTFNIKVNDFSKYYIYKRFAFLNSRVLSGFMTLFILSIWHGYHGSYAISFSYEFFVIQIENYLERRIKQAPANIWLKTFAGWIFQLILFQYTELNLFVCFCLLKTSSCYSAMRQIYFIPMVITALSYAVIYMTTAASSKQKST